MGLNLLEIIDSLQGEPIFFVEDGPLKQRVVEKYLEEEAHADILDFELDASVRIKRGEVSAAPTFECRLEADGFQYTSLFSVADFAADDEVIGELVERLSAYSRVDSKPGKSPAKNILRKRTGSGLLNIAEAAKALGLSHRTLKRLIPCSEIRIAEADGNKSIEEYYWEKRLIDRLITIWSAQQAEGGQKCEDLGFIAEQCCDDDLQWAKEIIAEFLQQTNLSGD
jgi:hypothetical protein